MLLRREAPLLARTNALERYSPAAAPKGKDAGSAAKSTAAAGKRQSSDRAASSKASAAIAASADDDGDFHCPSDDEHPDFGEREDSGGSSSSSSSDEGDDEDAEEASGAAKAGASKTSKKKAQKAKVKKLTKAEKDAEKDANWPDLAEGAKLPTSQKKEQFTGPEVGGPSAKCTRKAGDHPILYLGDLGYDDALFDMLTDNSNAYAAGLGAGTAKIYADFEPFDTNDIKKGVSILIRNGLSPVPRMRLNFRNPQSSFVWGDDRLRQLWPGKGAARWQMFRTFLHIEPPIEQVLKKTGDIQKDAMAYAEYVAKPLRKIEPLLSMTRERCILLWDAGWRLSLDEQTIGFQGKSRHKSRIRYKRTGDGFQCDAICEGGYTFNWYFRFDKAPDVQTGASPLHQRSIFLIDELPHDWHTIFCDNLYNSHQFSQWCAARKTYVCGTIRRNRGVPPKVIQKEVKGKKAKDAALGTLKVAHHSDGTLMFSYYDPNSGKPFHMVTSHHSSIEKVPVGKKVWDKKQRLIVTEMREVWNIVNDYNEWMNSVDSADQLRLQYYPAPKWFRNRKWWWSIFLWNLGLCCTNAYILHCKVEQRDGGTPLLHCDFLEQLCDKLAHPPVKAGCSKVVEGTRNPKLTDTRMDMRPWEACTMVDISGPSGSKPRCAWCKFKSRIRAAMDDSATKKVAETRWKKYCGHCVVPKHAACDATIFCNGCKHNFCGGACLREFHNPQSED